MKITNSSIVKLTGAFAFGVLLSASALIAQETKAPEAAAKVEAPAAAPPVSG